MGTSLGTWFPRVDGAVGRRAGISHGVVVTGTRMRPPLSLVPSPRYLFQVGEKRLVHRDKEGARRRRQHPQPGPLGTPVPPPEPQKAPG